MLAPVPRYTLDQPVLSSVYPTQSRQTLSNDGQFILFHTDRLVVLRVFPHYG